MDEGALESSGLWDADLDLLLAAAEEAGGVAMSYFGASPETWWKNEGRSPVTAADYAANDVLATRLRSARPEYGWVSEETEDDGDRFNHRTLFVVDPIDGTRAFMNGFKTWCVSVAVVQDGRPVAGVLVAPALQEVFSATVGGIALKNGRPITVASDSARPLAISASKDAFSRLPADIRDNAARTEHIPSLAYRLAMIADGRIDATLVRPHSHDWDIAAAELILERAGGRLLQLDGAPVRYNSASIAHGALCAASETVVEALCKAASDVFAH